MPSASALRIQIEHGLERRFPAALTPVPRTIRETASTGIPEVDRFLDGGLPVGAISEVTGPESSGRTSLALAFVAERTRQGQVCAWIDAHDAFDAESAAASGVNLERLLWVRCQGTAPTAKQAAENGQVSQNIGKEHTSGAKARVDSGAFVPGINPWPTARATWPTAQTTWPSARTNFSADRKDKPWTRLDQALRATDLLLQAGGFAALVLDLGNTEPEHGCRIPLATWFRFRQAADRTRCSLLVLAQEPFAQSSAAVVLECAAQRVAQDCGTVLSGCCYQLRSGRQRFAPERFTAKIAEVRKPPMSTWQAASPWQREKLQRNKNAGSTEQDVAMEFYGLPPIGQKQRRPMDGAQLHSPRVGNTGGELQRNKNAGSTEQDVAMEFYGLPPIGQKQRRPMDGAQLHSPRVGEAGGRGGRLG